MTRFVRFAAMALAVMVVSGTASPAHAALVKYITDGEFSNGTNSISQTENGVTITVSFTGTDNTFIGTEAPPMSTGEDFGTFVVTFSSTTPIENFSLSDTFILSISQVEPTTGDTVFNATLEGNIQINNSQAFVQFETGTKFIGLVSYFIVGNDLDDPGRVNLQRPTTSLSASTTLTGAVNVAPVPEPATLAMAFAGLPLVGLVSWHRRRKARA